MVETVVSTALEKLGNAAFQKALKLYGVIDQIKPVQRDLKSIQAFLRDAENKQQKSESVKEWVNRIREVAYRIEDAVEGFRVEIEENSSKSAKRNKLCGCFSKCWTVTKHPIKLNTLSAELKEISEEMKRINEIRDQLGITDLGSGSEEPAAALPPNIRPTQPFHVDDSEVVGFEVDRLKIISHLLDENISRRTVLSIVGVGGLGKTTLAQKVYKSTELEAKFPLRAWVSISTKFDICKLRKEILESVNPTTKDRNLSDKEVCEELIRSLSCERYLIILDDVWTVDLWEQLKITLPDKKNASRVIITTRFLDVALAADRNTEPHELNFLNEDESLTLLFRKALQQDIQAGKYPSYLVEVAKKLVAKCGRLPLALVLLGGMLSTKSDSSIDWTKVYNTLNWHNDQGKKCMQILRMSYQELGYEKKQCFMYFAAFPEDSVIPPELITRAWVAEGLIPENGMATKEEQAEEFLQDLVKRCLVQAVKTSLRNSISHKFYRMHDLLRRCLVQAVKTSLRNSISRKLYRMHDLLRDLAIHEAKENNFLTVFSKPEDGSQLATKETHRLALQFDIPKGYDIHSTNIRSLLCFGGCAPNYRGLTQLRVLAFQGIDFEGIEIGKNMLEGLVHMKYLGFRSCSNLSGILENISFHSTKNLETFDCYDNNFVDYNYINLSLWEVPTLRHVTVTPSYFTCPLKWDDLKNLQTLEWVTIKGIPKLESNVNLRTLKIYLHKDYEGDESGQAIEALLSRAEHLVNFFLFSDESLSEEVIQILGKWKEFPCYETVCYMALGGEWPRASVLSFEMFPKNLIELLLERSELDEDPMPVFERLQCLTILKLSYRSYMGEKMTCLAGGFPSLKQLKLLGIFNLSEWEIEKGAMPNLRKLSLKNCVFLSRFPDLQNVQSLRELKVKVNSRKVHRSLQSEDQYKIEHIPFVQISDPLYYNSVDDSYDDK